MNRRLVFVSTVSAAAAALAWSFHRAGYPGVIYDSFHYWTLSQIVSTEGLWNLSSRVRMYGYPLFVAVSTGFSDPSPEAARVMVSAVQLVCQLAAALYFARVSERLFRRPRVFEAAYAVLALNPIVLIRATELLSDSLSAVLVGLALFASLEEGHSKRRAFIAFLAAGASIAMRPANLVILPALAILWFLRARLYRERLAGPLALGTLAAAITLVPQLHGNVKAWNEWNPLLVDRLYSSQASWGTGILKYGTLVLPGKEPQLVYENPLRPEGVSTPGEFLRARPFGYLKTLGAHAFALVDHDFPFTYITSPPPPWGWALGLANYAFLFFSLLGLGLLLAKERGTPAGLYGAGAALFSAALVAIYLPVAVESRFSMPLYVILPPAAIFALLWLAKKRSGTIVAVAILGVGFIGACVQLSRWLSKLISGIEFTP